MNDLIKNKEQTWNSRLKNVSKQKDTAKSNWQKTLTNAFIPSVHRKTLVVG